MSKKDFSILYVDDEEQNLVSFRATFRREYNIHTAISGEEGIDIIRQHPINLIITDQRMPNMTGIQFLEKILPEYRDSSIRMVLTGFSDVEAIIGAINNGEVYRYVTKPWDEIELRMTIENARQLWSLKDENRNLVKELQLKMEEQEKTLRIFSKYVPQPVVDKVLREAEDTIFDGVQKEIAVLFCDIRGFTPFGESHSPKEVVTFLNSYYSAMTEVIKRYDGTVNQFVGDEIFAAFGAPLAVADCEKKAVFCALGMIDKLNALNERFENMFGSKINVGIGINYGDVIAGNLGSEEKIEYSLTGDTVNTGKRIENITKDKPNTILISDSIYAKVSEFVETKVLAPMAVKGKKGKIMVYEVLERK